MNKNDLIDQVADQTGVAKKDVDASITSMFDVIADAVSKGEEVQVKGWIKFERKDTPARKGHNPRTNQPIDIPAGTATRVKILSKLKEAGKSS